MDFSPVLLRRKKLNFAAATRQNYAAAGSGYKGVIPHCSGKCFCYHFSFSYYLPFAAAVKKVHLPLRVVPIPLLAFALFGESLGPDESGGGPGQRRAGGDLAGAGERPAEQAAGLEEPVARLRGRGFRFLAHCGVSLHVLIILTFWLYNRVSQEFNYFCPSKFKFEI